MEGGEESVSEIGESGGEQLMAINLDHSYCGREILRTTKINKSTHAACQIVPFEPLIPKLFLFCTYDDSFPCR